MAQKGLFDPTRGPGPILKKKAMWNPQWTPTIPKTQNPGQTGPKRFKTGLDGPQMAPKRPFHPSNRSGTTFQSFISDPFWAHLAPGFACNPPLSPGTQPPVTGPQTGPNRQKRRRPGGSHGPKGAHLVPLAPPGGQHRVGTLSDTTRGLAGPISGNFRPIRGRLSPFRPQPAGSWPFRAVKRPPTGASGELEAQTSPVGRPDIG